MMMRQLKSFIAVVDCGSLGAAARTLGVSQPAVTKAIRALEVTLGARLFDRAVGGSIPTDFGRALDPHARAIINQAQRAQREIGEIASARRGRVSVISGPLFAESLFPSVLQRFHEAHPLVEIALTTGYSDTMLAALRTGAAEIGFGMLGSHTVGADLATEVMMTDQRVIVAAGDTHPLARRRHVSAREAWDHQWVLPSHPDLFRGKLAEGFARAGLPMPAPSSEFNLITALRCVLRAGDYLGAVTEIAAREDLAAGTLREIRVPELAWTFAAGTLYRREGPMSPAAHHFIETARVVIREVTAKRR